MIFKNPKEYCKRIMNELIYYSLVLLEKVLKKNKSNNISVFQKMNIKNKNKT